jgi:deoxyhypusine synthase
MNNISIIALMLFSSSIGYMLAYLKYGTDSTKIPFIVSYQLNDSHIIKEIVINMNTKAVLLNDSGVIKAVVSDATNVSEEHINIISIRAEQFT